LCQYAWNLGNQLWTTNRYEKLQSYSYGNERPIVTSDATEALLGQKLSNGITVAGYRGIAETQIVVSCDWADDQWSQLRAKIPAHKEQASYQGLPAQNLQLPTRRLAFVCNQTRKCVLYLLCVISARVQINTLVKSGESTIYSCRVNPRHVTVFLRILRTNILRINN
jgi:hypothetical protein